MSSNKRFSVVFYVEKTTKSFFITIVFFNFECISILTNGTIRYTYKLLFLTTDFYFCPLRIVLLYRKLFSIKIPFIFYEYLFRLFLWKLLCIEIKMASCVFRVSSRILCILENITWFLSCSLWSKNVINFFLL